MWRSSLIAFGKHFRPKSMLTFQEHVITETVNISMQIVSWSCLRAMEFSIHSKINYARLLSVVSDILLCDCNYLYSSAIQTFLQDLFMYITHRCTFMSISVNFFKSNTFYLSENKISYKKHFGTCDTVTTLGHNAIKLQHEHQHQQKHHPNDKNRKRHTQKT